MKKKYPVHKFTPKGFLRFLGRKSKALVQNETLREIVRILGARSEPCVCFIEEHGYVDKDYQDEYAVFYSKAFRRYSSRCTRYHFLSVKVTKKDVSTIEHFSENYIGFIVLRPIEEQSVGRTLIKSDTNIDEYIHCLAEYSAHIMGNCLPIIAMPFTQQDSQVGACAQASLWMAARYMSARFGDREFTPSQITALATEHLSLGRTYPADRGLTGGQMLDALKGMGYPAESYDYHSVKHSLKDFDRYLFTSRTISKKTRDKKIAAAKLADIAYRYIESGLPVFFLTEDHAFVGIGHTYKSLRNSYFSIQNIPCFISNNDNAGPYQPVPIWNGGKGPIPFCEVTDIITIMPPEVSLRGEDAEREAWATIEELLKEGNVQQEIVDRPELMAWWYGPNILFRTYLIRSVALQGDLLRQMKGKELDPVVCRELLALDYPKYLWVTEVTSNGILTDKSEPDRKCLGCVLLDPTAPSGNAASLAAHFMDSLIVFRHETPDYNGNSQYHPHRPEKIVAVPGSTPFPRKAMTRTDA